MDDKTMKLLSTLALAFALLAGTAAPARDVDLVTLPPRAAVQLTIYNSEDLTLVRETRSITFTRGSNKLQFSWANTLIDPSSVYFRPVEHDREIEIADTTFPADRPQVLIWNVESKFEGQVTVEVSYFTSGISWNADYMMISDAAEEKASVDGYVTVINRSGEDYEGAQVRLVVGTINLVEKIAQLAQGGVNRGKFGSRTGGRKDAMLNALIEADRGDDKPREENAKRAPEIVKEGLSEYFIFTVEGQQTVKNGWSQRMVSFRAREVTFDVVYRYRPHQYGPRPVRFFILANDVEHKMGESPLPDGIIRVFRDNGKSGLGFFTAQTVKYIPIKEKVEMNVGTDDQIVYERVVLDASRSNFLYSDAPNPRVNGWDEARKWQEEIRNYRWKAIKMEIRHVLAGDVEFNMEAPGLKLYDFQTVEYTVDLPAGTTRKYGSDGTVHLGRAQKQARVKLAGQ
jgi:hypothetical protein